jgi:thymidine phosphorylase
LAVRGSTMAAAVAGILVFLAAAEMLHAALTAGAGRERREQSRALAAQLALTDLALFTEARYTRHRSLADLHSAFQDAPMAMEHFPAGSLVAPQRAFPEAALRGGTGD